MYAKIQITGRIEVVTGMHIGGSSAFAAIGSVDSPVIKDARDNLPMIPGSSFKGKRRTLLAKEFNKEVVAKPDDDDERLVRLFGSAKKGHIRRSRVQIADMVLANAEEFRQRGVQSPVEIKFENTINRLTAVANPRQIERVVRGSEFDLNMLYEVENETEIIEDMETLAEGMRLLEYDYLGGNGSRGYGKIRFKNIQADTVIGALDETIQKTVSQIFQGLE